MAQTPQPPQTPQSPATAGRPRCDCHCLLIGPQGDLTQRLASELPGYGVRLSAFADPGLIMGLTRAWRFDAVLIDARATDRRCAALVRAFAGRSGVPVLLLTDGSDEHTAIVEIERGAADVLAAQASPQLIASKLKRLSSLAREAAATSPGGTPSSSLQVGPLHLDLRNSSARVGGVALELPARSFAVLVVLARYANSVIDRGTLARHLGGGTALGSRALDMQVHRIRTAFTEAAVDGIAIETIYRRGYRLGLRGAA